MAAYFAAIVLAPLTGILLIVEMAGNYSQMLPLLVSCSDGKREWVPRANTRLEAHMHITAVVAPDAKNSIEILREGCTTSSYNLDDSES